MSEDITTIQVSEETWRRLNALKGPGDSFEDVVESLLDAHVESSSDGRGSALPDDRDEN